MVFYSIDLHTDSFVTAKITVENGKIDSSPIKTSKYYLNDSVEQFKNLLTKEDYVLVEACSNAFWFYDQIKALVKECYVLDVNKYKASINKTDKIDTKKLVKKLVFYVLMKGDQNDLPLVHVPPKEVRELRALFSTYRLNKKTMTQFKNRIHSVFTENGIDISKKELTNSVYREKLLRQPLSETWKLQLQTLFTQLDAIETETDKIKQMIQQKGSKFFQEEIRLLLGIKGFSLLTAIALMCDVVDINRFSSAKKFCAYLRTAPRVKSSNHTTVIGPTNRLARSLTCTLMAQSVEHFAGAGDHLASFYTRVKKGKKPGVYRMALIRKTLVCAYHMLKNKESFKWIDQKLYQAKLREVNNITNVA